MSWHVCQFLVVLTGLVRSGNFSTWSFFIVVGGISFDVKPTRADPYKVPIEAARMVCHPRSIYPRASYFKGPNRFRDPRISLRPLMSSGKYLAMQILFKDPSRFLDLEIRSAPLPQVEAT